ncbi:MAG TPA: hypothetical protein VME21_11000 [Steroidobacteraceae bacterium]|nr:hypothetical protein [Steroidobacteraceae bacterium]
MTTQELVQAASHIVAGMVAAEYAKGPVSPEAVAEIVRLGVRIARDIEIAARKF